MFHLSPADQWDLTIEERDTYLDAAEEYTRKLEEAANGE
jgi:hypothetical protein